MWYIFSVKDTACCTSTTIAVLSYFMGSGIPFVGNDWYIHESSWGDWYLTHLQKKITHNVHSEKATSRLALLG